MNLPSRMWHLAVGAGGAFFAVFGLIFAIGVPQAMAGILGIVSVVGAWLWLGPRAARTPQGWPVTVLHCALLVGASLAAVSVPVLAAVQAIAYPLVWVTAGSRARAIVTSAALALAVGMSLAGGIVTGHSTSEASLPSAVYSGAITAILSFGFATMMGLWVSALTRQSESRRSLIAELEAAQQKVRAASHDAGVSSERERIARELHDTVTQDLAGIVMGLQRLDAELIGHPAADTAAALRNTAESALADARIMVAENARPQLGGGVAAAVQRLVERFDRESGIRAEHQLRVDAASLAREHEVVLVRVAQEALANVRKHSHAGRCVVRLEEVDGAAVLTVTDNGTGIDSTTSVPGFGLDGMRERLALVGGGFAVDSSPQGTVLTASIPLKTPMIAVGDKS